MKFPKISGAHKEKYITNGIHVLTLRNETKNLHI